MAHTFTAEDRAKAKAVREFKKQLTQETAEEPQEVTQRITELEQLRSQRKLRALEENEMLAVQLENKRMRDELSGITNQNPQEKRSDLEMFKNFTEVQNQLSVANEKRETDLRNKIIDQLASNDAEPESTDDILLKTLLPKLLDGSVPIMKQNPQSDISNPQQQETPVPVEPKNTMENKTDKQIIDELPQYIKDAIKSGGLSLEQVLDSFEKQGQELTGKDIDKIQAIYKQIQGTPKPKKVKKDK